MAIGLFITKDIKVNIGEIKEKLMFDLDNASIKYDIPFDKINADGIKETIITMREPDIEISIENDIITYIKTVNTEFSNLDKIENTDVDITNHIKKIREQLNNKFDTNDCNIKIEKLDSKTLNITLIIISEADKCRIQIIRDTFGNVYINTIRAL